MSVNIIIKNAQKRYGDNIIIEDLSLDIRQGGVFYSPWTFWVWKNYFVKNDSRI